MDSTHVSRLIRFVEQRWTRRHAVIAAALTIPALDLSLGEAKGKKKKKSYCLNGQTVKAKAKKKKKLIKRGATPGACVSDCTPQCDGTSCGGTDGCGGTCGCGSSAICQAGTCRTCTVTCTESPTACGSKLAQALKSGGTMVICPGRYAGNFSVSSASTLIGAGSGEDAATNTILDANDSGRVLLVPDSGSLSLSRLRVTGGNLEFEDGGGIWARASSRVELEDCTIQGNSARFGGGIAAVGQLRVRNSSIIGNEASREGGGVFLEIGDASSISNSSISNNSALQRGGGISSNGTAVTLTDSTLDRNVATDEGGGLYIFSTTVTFNSGSKITNNTAANGGGVFVGPGASMVNLNGATLTGNSTPQCTGNGC